MNKTRRAAARRVTNMAYDLSRRGMDYRFPLKKSRSSAALSPAHTPASRTAYDRNAQKNRSITLPQEPSAGSRAPNQRGYARHYYGARAHRARLQRDEHRASVQTPASACGAGHAYGLDLRVRRGVGIGLAPVAPAADDIPSLSAITQPTGTSPPSPASARGRAPAPYTAHTPYIAHSY